MMTGRYPSYFGFDGNAPPERPPRPEDLRAAMGHVFRAAGYRTVFGGKTHWPKPMTPEAIGFEYLTADERDGLADKCVDFLAAKQDQPFLLVASFINPHDICLMAIDAYTKANHLPAMYPKLEIERKRVAEAMALPDGVSRSEFFRKHCPPLPANHKTTDGEPSVLSQFGSFRGWARRHWTEEDWRLHRWAYCRLTERVDAEIGRVLTALRNSGRERNTVVVFSSDHGDMDGAHGFEHKSLPYEESARVPLLVSWPGRVPARKINRTHLVSSTVDLLPSLCDFAGIPPPPGLPGLSIRSIAEGKTPSRWREDLLIEFTGGKCLRGRRHKYSVWEKGENREMLIDMEKDPGETKNLANDPAAEPVLTAFRSKFKGLA
jgi:choline-sulfatase